MRALVVDDSTAMRAVLKRILSMRGFEVLEAKNGLDALSTLEKSGATDLMLVDWNMPEMNGLELVSRVRQNHSFDGIRIMMVTTETGIKEVQNALTAGANDYLMKPFSSTQVDEKLTLLGLATDEQQN